MFCPYCGGKIDDKAVTCPYCQNKIANETVACTDYNYGTDLSNGEINFAKTEREEISSENNHAKTEKKETNGIAIAGFVCSFFIPLLGWIFGGIGLNRALKRNNKGKGFSIAAIAIASATFLFNLM